MRIPPATKAKYEAKLDQLIQQGRAVPVRDKSVARGGNFLTGQTNYSQVKDVSWSEFVEWRTSCITVLDQVVPKTSIHRKTIESFGSLGNDHDRLLFGLSFLTSIRQDLADRFLDDLAADIEAELSADYLGQAERLVGEQLARDLNFIPAVVLAGAVLEKSLRSMCGGLIPPEPITNNTGQPHSMGALIDALRKRGVFNELTAKQLRAWAAIRNSAAHGHFAEFTREQASALVTGIGVFLTQNL